METSERKWWTRTPEDGEQGPIEEEDFQERLRSGKVPLHAELKSNLMDDWQPLLDVISNDESFHRRSTPPPVDIPDEE
jgi:hypothetical protein